jgi:hypothetical protein
MGVGFPPSSSVRARQTHSRDQIQTTCSSAYTTFLRQRSSSRWGIERAKIEMQKFLISTNSQRDGLVRPLPFGMLPLSPQDLQHLTTIHLEAELVAVRHLVQAGNRDNGGLGLEEGGERLGDGLGGDGVKRLVRLLEGGNLAREDL